MWTFLIVDVGRFLFMLKDGIRASENALSHSAEGTSAQARCVDLRFGSPSLLKRGAVRSITEPDRIIINVRMPCKSINCFRTAAICESANANAAHSHVLHVLHSRNAMLVREARGPEALQQLEIMLGCALDVCACYLREAAASQGLVCPPTCLVAAQYWPQAECPRPDPKIGNNLRLHRHDTPQG